MLIHGLKSGLNKLNLSPINSIAAVKVKDCSRYGSLKLNNKKVQRLRKKNLQRRIY